MLRKIMSDFGASLSETLRQNLSRTHNLMLRKIMSDLGPILSETLRQNLSRTHNLMLRKFMSDLGAVLSEILSKIFQKHTVSSLELSRLKFSGKILQYTISC